MTEETVGERVKARRLEVGLTQEQLARRADITVMAVSRIERNDRTQPRLDTIKALATALDVDPSWLAWGEEVKTAA